MALNDIFPLVSIGFPVYNGERTVRQAINALLAQDYANFELIISDNASTDNTGVICREYATRDQRVRYYRNEINKGAVWNFNRVFELAAGKYFMWAAHDDWHSSNYISKCLVELDKKPSNVLCYTLTQYVDQNGSNIRIVDSDVNTRGLNYFERLHTIILGMSSAVALYGVIRAETLRRTTLNQHCIHSDKCLLYQLAIMGHIVMVPEVLHFYRYSEKSVEQYVDQVKIRETSDQNPVMPLISLPAAITKAIFHLNIHPLKKPLLIIDALYCLRRRYHDRFKREIKLIHEIETRTSRVTSL